MTGPTQNDENETIRQWRQDSFKECNDNIDRILEVWKICYGPDDRSLNERIRKINIELKTFWTYQTEAQVVTQKNLMNAVNQCEKEALELEKAMGLSGGVISINQDLPLVVVEDQMWKLLNSYQDKKGKQLFEYSVLLEQERELCQILNDTMILLPKGAPSSSSISKQIPTSDDMVMAEDRVNRLRNLKAQLELDFETYKNELRTLIIECEKEPSSLIERFVTTETEAIEFPVTKQNFDNLKAATEHYRMIKEEMIMEAENLRQELAYISKKMLQDQDQLDDLLCQNSGFTKSTLAKLKEQITCLKEERKSKLENLILSHRSLLDEWWTRCCYSDEQRAQFEAYNVDYYSEEILNFHELELEELQNYYSKNKRIFQLAEKHSELWQRLLHLEEEALKKNRLFDNRGGRLLQEEKERTLLQKKVPIIKEELFALLNEYKTVNEKEFLYFGDPLISNLKQMEEEREMSKENRKQARKLTITDSIQLETKPGSHLVPGSKRKVAPEKQTDLNKAVRLVVPSTGISTATTPHGMLGVREHGLTPRTRLRTPIQPSSVGRSPYTPVMALLTPTSSPVMSTTLNSRPDNGSLSYESFQEYLEKSKTKEVCRSSTKNPFPRVLQPNLD